MKKKKKSNQGSISKDDKNNETVIDLTLFSINILPRFVINCADKSGDKILKIFASKKIQSALNRLPSASVQFNYFNNFAFL